MRKTKLWHFSWRNLRNIQKSELLIAYRNNVTRDNQRDLYKDIKWLLEIVTLERELTLTVEDTTLLILSVVVLTINFTIKGLIEKVHKFAHKSLVEARNYLGFDNTENPLILYQAVLTNRKDKNQLSLISLPLIVPKGLKDSVSSLLLQYNTQISSSLESKSILLLLYNINNSSAFRQPLLVWEYINYEFT